MKHNNIQITGIPGEEKDQGIEILFEKIMTENFPNLEREKTMQVQVAKRVPIKMNPKRCTPRHVNKLKGKEIIFKAARKKELVTCKGAPIKLAANILTETLQTRRE